MQFKSLIGGVVLAMAGPSAAAATADMNQAAVVIRLVQLVTVSDADLSRARSEAGRILTGVGLGIEWVNCSNRKGDPAQCGQVPRQGELIVRLTGEYTPTTTPTVSMGQSFVDPTARHAFYSTVYVDRVRSIARSAGVDPRPLLGRAIAHEVGHLLLNTNAHAHTGLMRAVWSQLEMSHEKAADWSFAADEGRAMRASLADPKFQ